MRNYLIIHKVWSAVERDAKFDALPAEAQVQMDMEASAYISFNVSDQMIGHIEMAATAKNAWDALQRLYARNTLGSTHRYRKEMMQLARKQDEDGLEFLGRAHVLRNKLKDCCDVTIADDEFVMYILDGLGPEYEQFVRLARFDLKSLSVDELSEKLRNCAPEVVTSPNEKVWNVNQRAGSHEHAKGCFYCGDPGHWKRDCSKWKKKKEEYAKKDSEHKHVMMVTHAVHKTPVESLTLEIMMAEFAQELHRAEPELTAQQLIDAIPRISDYYQQARMTPAYAEDMVSLRLSQNDVQMTPEVTSMIQDLALIMTPPASIPIKIEPDDQHVVLSVNSQVVGVALDNAHGIKPAFDSGASVHIINVNTGPFVRSFRPMNGAKVTVSMAGGEVHSAMGYVTYELEVAGQTLQIEDALYVPTATECLISISKACHGRGKTRGFLFNEFGVYLVTQGQHVRIGAPDEGGLFRTVNNGSYVHSNMTCHRQLNWNNKPPKVFMTTTSLLHRRLGHPSCQILSHMCSHACAHGLPNSTKKMQHKCDVCMQAKMPRPPFSDSDSQATEPLQLVHADVMGPFPVPSLGGAKFAMVMVDDHSRLIKVRCLKSKAQVPATLQQALTQWETQTGRKVLKVRTDNGSEFKNSKMTEFYQQKGIIHQTSAVYTPQQNGRAERPNRTLMDIARAFLFDAHADPGLWGEGLMTGAHVYNMTPSITQTKTPHERFWGFKPNVKMLRVFGCKAYVQVHAHMQKKARS